MPPFPGNPIVLPYSVEASNLSSRPAKAVSCSGGLGPSQKFFSAFPFGGRRPPLQCGR